MFCVCFERERHVSVMRVTRVPRTPHNHMAPHMHKLNCLIEGEFTVFVVPVLKGFIQRERVLGTLKDADPHILELCHRAAM